MGGTAEVYLARPARPGADLPDKLVVKRLLPHFATDKKNYLANFIWGMLILYPFIIVGLVSTFLKDLMVNLGPTFLEQSGVLVPAPDVIGIMYQLSVLIVPTLLPMLIWAWQNREAPLLQNLFRKARGPGDQSASP